MTETSACTGAEKLAALERALASRTLARSEQLRAFLRFVCEAEMKGAGADLAEYVIGVEVLGRPEGYSPAEDSSVRTRAYELRRKLEKLYSVELPNEPMQIAMAKGAYCPQFVKTAVREEMPEPLPPPVGHEEIAVSGHTGHGGRALALAAGMLLSAALGALLTYLAMASVSRPGEMDPVVAEAWRPMARRDANVVLSVAAPLHLILGSKGRDTHGLPAYPAPPETYPLYQQHRPLTPGTLLDMTFTDNAIGFGTMNSVIATIRILRSFGSSYQVLPDRAVPMSALRDRNVVLFGNPAESETINRTMADTPLTVDFEPSARAAVIRDRVSGRMMVPKGFGKGGFTDVYGLITVLNTRDSDRGHLGMVVFSGINSAGTDGAAEFFSSPRSLRQLRSVFAQEHIHGFPAAYQVVVKCTFGDLLMISYEYTSHRVIQK